MGREASQELLAALGARRSRLTGRHIAPHVATFRRVLKTTDADAVDTVIGVYLAERGASPRWPVSGTTSGEGAQQQEAAGDDQHDCLEEHRQQQADSLVGALESRGKRRVAARQADGRAVHLL